MQIKKRRFSGVYTRKNAEYSRTKQKLICFCHELKGINNVNVCRLFNKTNF